MNVELQTIDGQFFSSDPFDNEYDVNLTSVADELRGLFTSWREMDYLSLVIGGRVRYFNPANVLWAEIVN
jgi:hypothetical protein